MCSIEVLLINDPERRSRISGWQLKANMSPTHYTAANKGQMGDEDTEKLCHKMPYNEFRALSYISVVLDTNRILFSILDN